MIQGFWFFKNVLIYRVKQGLVFCPFYLFAIVFFLKSLIQPAIFNYNKIYDNFNRKRVYFLRNNNWHYTSEIYTHMILNKAPRLRKYLKSRQSWLLFASVTISSMVFWLLAFKSFYLLFPLVQVTYVCVTEMFLLVCCGVRDRQTLWSSLLKNVTLWRFCLAALGTVAFKPAAFFAKF